MPKQVCLQGAIPRLPVVLDFGKYLPRSLQALEGRVSFLKAKGKDRMIPISIVNI